MTVLALASAKGAPGVTTSALLLAALWPGALLVEADPAGGDLRCWLTDSTGAPLSPDRGVVSLLSAHQPTGVVTDRRLTAHSQQVAGGLPILLGPGSPAQAGALRGLWPQFATAVQVATEPVVVDVGRVDARRDTDVLLLRAVARVLLVCRPEVASLLHTRDLLDAFTAQGVIAEVLLVGTGAQRDDTARSLGGVQVHLLPEDPDAARALSGGMWNRKLDRSPLLAAGRRLVTTLSEDLHPAAARAPSGLPERDGALVR